jgi:hypothetical protein
MGQWMVLARILFTAGSLLSMVAMHDTLLGRAVGQLNSAYLGSLVVICTLGYYVLGKIGQAAAGNPLQGRHGTRSPAVYMDMQQQGKTAIVTGVPKLTIENVWILVYGLGAVVFIMSYTCLGVQPISLTCMGVGMGVLGADELIHPRREMLAVHAAVRIGALLSGLTALCLVFVESFGEMIVRFLSSGNWPAAVGGIGLPFLSQFGMLCVRDYRRYTVGGVIEMCEFGLPFAVILSCCLLWTAEASRRQAGEEASYALLYNETMSWYRNLTVDRAQDPVASWAVYLSLVPLLLAPTLVLYVACILEGCAVDPLLGVSLAVAIQYTIWAGPSVLNIYALLCSCVGVVLRTCSELQLAGGGHYNAQADSPQIPSAVLREAEIRDLQAASAAAAETSPLNPDSARV